MFVTDVNYLAVLVAAVINMALGALWYSPVMFGKMWMQLMNFTPEKMAEAKKGMGKAYVAAFLGALVMSYFLAVFVATFGAGSFGEGAQVGAFLWLGMIATTSLSAVLWEGKSPKLYYMFNSYQLVILVITGGMLAVWM